MRARTRKTLNRCLILSLIAFAVVIMQPKNAAAEKNKWVAAGLNFFIPGAGYMYNAKKPLYVSVPLVLGAVGLTYLEQVHKYGDSDQNLLEYDSTAFGIMFATVLVMNTAFAIDAFREAKAINRAERQGAVSDLRLDLKPIRASDGKTNYGLALSGRF